MINTGKSSVVGDLKIFAANANPELAKAVVKHLGLELSNATTDRFTDGEVRLVVDETVRGKDVFIIQPTCPPVNDNLMELLIMLDAMRRSSAGRITAVMPYFGYARQDRRSRSHDPISGKLVADMITNAGANRILAMELHCPQLQGFFNIPLDHLKGVYTFAAYLRSKDGFGEDLSDVVIVSPDLGGVTRAKALADELKIKTPIAIVDKRRIDDKTTEIENFIGDVRGKYAVMVDDVIATGGSLCSAAKTVMERGAKEVYACVTHPILCGKAVENIKNSVLKELVVLNTVNFPEKTQKLIGEHNIKERITVLSIAKYLAESIDCIHNSQSLGNLFTKMSEQGKSAFEVL